MYKKGKDLIYLNQEIIKFFALLLKYDLPIEMAVKTFIITFFFQVLFLESRFDLDIFSLGTAIFFLLKHF